MLLELGRLKELLLLVIKVRIELLHVRHCGRIRVSCCGGDAGGSAGGQEWRLGIGLVGKTAHEPIFGWEMGLKETVLESVKEERDCY